MSIEDRRDPNRTDRRSTPLRRGGRRAVDQPSDTAWTVSQLAFYISMSADFIRSEIRAGEIKASMFGREWRIATTEVVRYLDTKQFPVPGEQ